ncbi:hypothetical protein [Pseudomonas sp.]|uniref:hypothetical protein n=1 Tax=Pseudomonas sp. TaxID=306 RepID=UPI002736F589|nr:hypothetical protein [Pseudomonas sp.]MDP3814232.1 hypothetical protein [Pseudomonas sp.]
MAIEEFINPKSMLTPAFASAVVAAVAGALFKGFGLAVPFGSIALSFLICAVIFESKEFKNSTTPKLIKGVLYVLNSLIVFAMATGATAVMADDSREDVQLIQQRPYFYNWTQERAKADAESLRAPLSLKVDSAPVERGGLGTTLQRAGILTTSYQANISLDIRDRGMAQQIESVEFVLPDKYFEQSHVRFDKQDIGAGKSLNIELWEPFEIEANVLLESGETLHLKKMISTAKE